MLELTRRYVVMAMATHAPFDPADPEGVFVLKPWKDPAALHALRAYAEACYPELARDLEAWIREIERGPAVRGDVGRRNEPPAHAAARRTAAGARAARGAAPAPAGARTVARAKPGRAAKARPKPVAKRRAGGGRGRRKSRGR
jgi:hypothetical protein